MMDALRKAIARYAQRLDQQANRHTTYAFVLEAVAHRLRQILHDNPEPFWYREHAVKINGKIVPLNQLGGPETPLNTPGEGVTGKSVPMSRWVTVWKETK